MKMNLILAAVTLGSFLVAFHAEAAGPQTVSVDCDKGKSINDKVAKLDADKDYIVKISGTCNESVQVEDFEGVTLQLVGDPTATLNDPTGGSGTPVISVTDSRRVTISGLTINGPVRLTDCLNCFFTNNILNSHNTGIVFFQSQGIMQANKIYITFTPPQGPIGVGVSGLSDVGMFGNEIHGIGGPVGVGVSVTLSSQVRMSGVPGPAIIEGFTTGLQIRDGSALLSGGPLQCGSPLTACISVSNNVQGARITSANAILGGMTLDNNGQGVFAEQGSSVSVGPNSAVTNSTGVPIGPSLGVFATHNSSVVVGSNTSITNNGTRGVAVGTSSTALLAPPGLTISGQIKNVTCDATSIVTSANSYAGGPPPVADCPNQIGFTAAGSLNAIPVTGGGDLLSCLSDRTGSRDGGFADGPGEKHPPDCRGAVPDRESDREYPDLFVADSRTIQPWTNRPRKVDRSERLGLDRGLDFYWDSHSDVLRHLPAGGSGGRRAGGDFNRLGLLRRPNDDDSGGSAQECKENDYTRQAFYPLTMPLTVGPGSISVAITVGANRPEGSEWAWPMIGGMLLGSALISASIYLSYRFAERIGRTLGDSAMNIIIRLSSFILVCIGVQILWNGLSALLRTLVR